VAVIYQDETFFLSLLAAVRCDCLLAYSLQGCIRDSENWDRYVWLWDQDV